MMIGGVSFLILGVLFLLQDFKIWNFWNISWYAALFVVVGIGQLGSSRCPNCEAIRSGKK